MPRASARPTPAAVPPPITAPIGRTLLWVGLLGAWLFLLASLFSFNPGDPPTHNEHMNRRC